jgi:hypothetical protein
VADTSVTSVAAWPRPESGWRPWTKFTSQVTWTM